MRHASCKFSHWHRILKNLGLDSQEISDPNSKSIPSDGGASKHKYGAKRIKILEESQSNANNLTGFPMRDDSTISKGPRFTPFKVSIRNDVLPIICSCSVFFLF